MSELGNFKINLTYGFRYFAQGKLDHFYLDVQSMSDLV
jgi:hypothetical protein